MMGLVEGAMLALSGRSLRCWVLHVPQPKDKGTAVSHCLQKLKRYEEGTSPRVMKLECHRFNSQVCLGGEAWLLSAQGHAEKPRSEKPGRMNVSREGCRSLKGIMSGAEEME